MELSGDREQELIGLEEDAERGAEGEMEGEEASAVPGWLEDAVPSYFADPQPASYADFPFVKKTRPGVLAMAVLRQNLACVVVQGCANFAIFAVGFHVIVASSGVAGTLCLLLTLGGVGGLYYVVAGSLRNLRQRSATCGCVVVGGAVMAVARFADVDAVAWGAAAVNLALLLRAAAAHLWPRQFLDMPANYREFLDFVGLLRGGPWERGPAPDATAFDREVDRARAQRRKERAEARRSARKRMKKEQRRAERAAARAAASGEAGGQGGEEEGSDADCESGEGGSEEDRALDANAAPSGAGHDASSPGAAAEEGART